MPARAQNDTVIAKDLRLSEVEVTAQGVQTCNDLHVVTCLNHNEIQALPTSCLSDILAYLPGIDVRSRGDSHAQADVSLYGGTFDQVLIMLNGIPVNDAQTGHYTMNLPLSASLIERIEIMPYTAANQTGALSGAINIVTRQANNDTYSLQMDAGTNSDIAPAFIGSWRRNDVYINTSVEYSQSDGYYAPTADAKEKAALLNTDYRMANLYLQTRWQDRLDVQLGAQYKDAGLGTGYGFASIDQLDATRTLFATARYEEILHRDWDLQAHASYRANYDRYEWHRGTVTNRHWTHVVQAGLYATADTHIAGKTTFGIEMKDEYIHSTNMGEHNRLHATLSAEHNYRYGHWEASLSAAGHYNTWFGWNGSGAAHVGYKRTRNGIALSAARSLRMPTWTDLFYKAGVQRGSTDLKAEKAWQLTLNGHYAWHWQEAGCLSLSGDVYYRWGENILDWTYDETDSLFHATNQNKVNTFGIEATASYRLNDWLRNIQISYAYTNLSLDMTKTKSNYLDYLRHKIALNINHGIYVWSKGYVGAEWSLRWQDREGTYVDINGKAGNPYEPVLLLDGSIYMELAHIRVALECTNMTNRHYYDYGGVLHPGAHGCIRIKTEF